MKSGGLALACIIIVMCAMVSFLVVLAHQGP